MKKILFLIVWLFFLPVIAVLSILSIAFDAVGTGFKGAAEIADSVGEAIVNLLESKE